VNQLDGLAAADRSHINDLLADRLQYGEAFLEGLFFAADHDDELRILRP